MFGYTFGNLENEVLFVRNSLLGFSAGDLLAFNVTLASSPADKPLQIQKPRRRRFKDVVRVDFHWNLETHCPVPGSYALCAVATVQLHAGAERQFSMFRFRRYAPDKVAECLHDLGWDEIAVMPFGGANHPSSLRLFCKLVGGNRTFPSPVQTSSKQVLGC